VADPEIRMARVFSYLAGTLIFAALAGAVTVALQAQTDRTGTLTGAWTLNKDLTEDPMKLMENMMAGDHGGGGGGHRPPAGFGGHGGGGSRGGATPEQMRAMRARIIEVLEAPAKLTILEGDGTVTLTADDGRARRLMVNNKREKRPVDNRMVDVRTKRDDGRLVTEMWLDDGMKLTETYAVSADRRQLQVSLKLEGSHLPRTINVRRVYDADALR
jgi:hypothetical protein